MIENSKFNQNSKFKILNFKLLFFLTIFIFQLACLFFIVALPVAGQAAEPAKFTPQVGVGTDFQTGKSYAPNGSTAMIAEYIRAIYKYAIGIVGILAAVVLMVGGVMWIIAGGSATMIGEAKAWIGASLTGLTLALLSYLILATVNPALVDLRTTAIENVAPAAGTTILDPSTDCGLQVSGQSIICGSKCPNGRTCEKVSEGTVGAKKCPETLTRTSGGPNTGSGDYYLCSTLSGGGNNCCDNNNDSQCSSGYICNMQINAGACPGKGTCALKQGSNGVCGENDDCTSGNCSTGFLATYRCQ